MTELGESCLALARHAADLLGAVPGCRVRFEVPFFREFVLEVPAPASDVLAGLADRGYLAGPSLERFPGMESCLLVALTERRTAAQIEGLASALESVLS
jgi:glycine dehydrogenase subunit 1